MLSVKGRLASAAACVALLAFAPVSATAAQPGATAPLEDREIIGFSQVLRRNQGPDVTQSAPENPVAPAPEIEQEEADELRKKLIEEQNAEAPKEGEPGWTSATRCSIW